MNAQRLAVAVTLVNLVLLAILLGQASTTSAETEGAVLRGRALELVDASGHVRAQFNVEPDGEAVFRIRDAAGTIRVKIGASADGSGLLLLDETTEPAVHIVARRSATSARPATTSLTLTGQDGRRRTITP